MLLANSLLKTSNTGFTRLVLLSVSLGVSLRQVGASEPLKISALFIGPAVVSLQSQRVLHLLA